MEIKSIVVRYRAKNGVASAWSNKIKELLESGGFRVLLEPSSASAPESSACRADLLVVVGGDGTLLNTVGVCDGKLPPVLGFSVNSLGYLLPHRVETYEAVLRKFLAREYRVDEIRLGRCSYLGGSRYFLNEVGIWAPRGKLIECEVRVGGHELYRPRCDGLIISTPAGSTAHALSYGGPVILGLRAPVLEVLVLGSLSPLVRPILSCGKRVEVTLLPSSEPASLIIDGRFVAELSGGSSIKVAPSKRKLRMISVEEYSTSIARKLFMRLTDMGRALPPE